uniref:Uncharacterized protein n=1 Tax=Rhizophora mucronata TaxID=61149 RepID=A0A2P2J462_RHIMU
MFACLKTHKLSTHWFALLSPQNSEKLGGTEINQ